MQRTFSQPSVILSLLALLAGLLATPAVAQPPDAPPVPTNRTVVIDCDAGGSLADALATRADQLTVRFRGTCVGGVTIDRGNVSLEGLDASATVSGGGDIGVTVSSGPNRLQGFLVTGYSAAGVFVTRNGEATLEDLEVSGNNVGLAVDQSSSAAIADLVANHNSLFGISAFGDSNLEVTGPIVASDNTFLGILVSTGASLQTRGPAASLLGERNGFAALWLQLGATAQSPVLTGRNNFFSDLVLFEDCFFAGQVDLSRSPVGLFATKGSHFFASGSISAFQFGISADEETVVDFSGTISGSAVGIFADGTVIELDDSRVDSAQLSFASRLTVDSNTTIGNLVCDATVLTRGISCPSPLTTPQELVAALNGGPTPPSEAFSNPMD